tara:strand:+ start:284 stop:553 length:270 start_codon:yes stop_codon:yes gene_type:complete
MKKSSNFSSKAHSSKTIQRSLYLINDEYNTFEHVINCLVAICEHNELQAEQCALLTHYRGNCEIATGRTQDLILLQEDLVLYGLDVEIL